MTATSSSRLNLTELVINDAQFSLNSQATCANAYARDIMPIAISTPDEDTELKYIAVLSDRGTIELIDPITCTRVIELRSDNEQSTSSSDKWRLMTYCYGIDEICAISESGRIQFVSMSDVVVAATTATSPMAAASTMSPPSPLLALSNGTQTTHATPSTPQSQQTPATTTTTTTTTTPPTAAGQHLAQTRPLTNAAVSTLHKLIAFDTAKLAFAAKFPVGWTLVLAEQQSQAARKHPQHMNADAATSGLTKCWRYVNLDSATSLNEHTSNTL